MLLLIYDLYSFSFSVKAILLLFDPLSNRVYHITNEFSKNWDILGFDDEDLRILELSILEHPEKYPIMKGTGGLRKARISIGRKGKSGGARVCFVDFIFVETVYLITVYGKKEKDNLSNAERNQIKKMIDTLKKT